MQPGRYRCREDVTLAGSLLCSRRPLTVTRLNDAALSVVGALDSERFGDRFVSPEEIVDRVGGDPTAVATLLEGLHRRGFLEWVPDREPGYRPLVSVVVTTLDAATELGPCLDALAALDYSRYEVILVDGGSTDETVELAEAHELTSTERLRVIEPEADSEPLSIGTARNHGVAVARGEVVAFTDADCRPRPAWLADLVPCLANHDVVGGRIRPHGNSSVSVYEGYNSSLDMGPRSERVDPDSATPYLPTANLLARKSVLESVTFPERNVAEDVAFCWRAIESGFDVVYHAAGVVEHDFRDRPRSFAGRRATYARSEALLAREFGRGDSVPVSASALLGMLAVFVALVATRFGASPVAFVTGIVGAAALVGSPAWRAVVAFRSLRGTIPARDVFASAGRSVLSTWYAVAAEFARYYSGPVALVGLVLAGSGVVPSGPATTAVGVVLLAGVALAVVFPPAIEVLVRRPPMPIRYGLWSLLDDASYQFGAYSGALAHRTVEHLVPWKRFRIAGA